MERLEFLLIKREKYNVKVLDKLLFVGVIEWRDRRGRSYLSQSLETRTPSPCLAHHNQQFDNQRLTKK